MSTKMTSILANVLADGLRMRSTGYGRTELELTIDLPSGDATEVYKMLTDGYQLNLLLHEKPTVLFKTEKVQP